MTGLLPGLHHLQLREHILIGGGLAQEWGRLLGPGRGQRGLAASGRRRALESRARPDLPGSSLSRTPATFSRVPGQANLTLLRGLLPVRAVSKIGSGRGRGAGPGHIADRPGRILAAHSPIALRDSMHLMPHTSSKRFITMCDDFWFMSE